MSSTNSAESTIIVPSQKSNDDHAKAFQQARELAFGPIRSIAEGAAASGAVGSAGAAAGIEVATKLPNLQIDHKYNGPAGADSGPSVHRESPVAAENRLLSYAGDRAWQAASHLSAEVRTTLKTNWTDFQRGVSTVENIAPKVGAGALDELEHHTLNVAGNVVLGAGIGLGLTLIAPEATLAVGLAAAGLAGYELATNIPRWLHDAKVEANPSQFSKTDVAAADSNFKAVGASMTDMTAGMLGGGVGQVAGDALNSAAQSDLMREAAAILRSSTLPPGWNGESMSLTINNLGSLAEQAVSRSNLTSLIAGAVIADSNKHTVSPTATNDMSDIGYMNNRNYEASKPIQPILPIGIFEDMHSIQHFNRQFKSYERMQPMQAMQPIQPILVPIQPMQK